MYESAGADSYDIKSMAANITASHAVKTKTKKALTKRTGLDIRRLAPIIEINSDTQVASEKKKKRLNSADPAKAHK